MAKRHLTDQEIESLAGLPGVRRVAVENFLMSLPIGPTMHDSMNLSIDAVSYKWNVATRNAIRAGISLAAREVC